MGEGDALTLWGAPGNKRNGARKAKEVGVTRFGKKKKLKKRSRSWKAQTGGGVSDWQNKKGRTLWQGEDRPT